MSLIYAVKSCVTSDCDAIETVNVLIFLGVFFPFEKRLRRAAAGATRTAVRVCVPLRRRVSLAGCSRVIDPC